jgi:hypothetical protein
MRMLGAARRRRVGRMGASRRVLVRGERVGWTGGVFVGGARGRVMRGSELR